jgi:hypothetical protein
MYIPLDPIKVDGCWKKLEESLLAGSFSCVIHDGKKTSENFYKVNITEIVKKMQQADYVRLGSNKMVLMPVHFAIKFLNYSTARINELISLDNSEERIKNDLALVIQFAFFENANLETLIVPIIVKEFKDIDAEIDGLNGQMIIKRQK